MYLENRKACLTCEFWSGARTTYSMNSKAKCDSRTDLGKCLNGKCTYKNKETKAGYSSCLRYEKWGKLK